MMDVSVIIPAYNRLWCLPRAIESCRHTKHATEIIVVDDGSTDGTWEWLQTQLDIVALRQENQGQTYAINAGTRRATGKYIRFLDSDDFLEPGIIDRQFEAAVSNRAQLVCSRVDSYIEETGEKIKAPDISGWNDFLEVQLGNGYGSHFLGMLFHSELVEKTPRRPDFAWREDRMFLLEIALLNPKIAIVEGCAGYWVKHKEQMQANYSGLKAQVVNWQLLQIYKKILGKLETEGRLTKQYKGSACTILWPLAHWIAINHLEEAIEIVEWIYKLNPAFTPPEKGALGVLYKAAGFKRTERILHFRRSVKRLFSK